MPAKVGFPAHKCRPNGMAGRGDLLARDLQDEERGARQGTSRNQMGIPIWKEYWKIRIPHKVLLFGWKVMKNGLATQDNKRIRQQQDCFDSKGKTNKLGMDEGAKLLLLLWRTWQVRNNTTHESEKLSIEGSIRFLQKYWTELCSIRQQQDCFDSKGKNVICESLCTGSSKKKTKKAARWESPEQGWLKINVDGAFDYNAGTIQLTTWKCIPKGRDAEEPEVMADKEGLMLAAEWCDQKAILESDCSIVAGMLAKRDGGRSNLKFILEEAMAAGGRLPAWKILAERTKHSAVWRFMTPMCVEQIIARDCNLTPE
uniref:RNase H type-1 domain-containing protein n=1 Tax=Setaria italica TaxID=4555 RepID=K3ZD33_SETIT